MTVRALTATLVGCVLSAAASAAEIRFDTGPGVAQRANSYSFSNGGVGVTLTSPGNRVSHYWEGAGVSTGTFNLNTLQHNETLVLTFNQTVRLNKLSFRQWENGFDKVVLGSSAGYLTLGSSAYKTDALLVDWFLFDTPLLVDSISLKGDNFVTAAWLRSVDVEAVPLPAAAWLLGSALLGLGGTAARRRRAVAG